MNDTREVNSIYFFSVANIATLPTALAAAQLRAAPFLWGPWRELWELLLGFFWAETLLFGPQLSYSINPGVTAELTHLAVRQAQIIHRPVGGCDSWQPLSDEGQVLCWSELGQHGREASRALALKSGEPGLSKVTEQFLCINNYSFQFHQDLAASPCIFSSISTPFTSIFPSLSTLPLPFPSLFH